LLAEAACPGEKSGGIDEDVCDVDGGEKVDAALRRMISMYDQTPRRVEMISSVFMS
jgi:hypothetical protein